MTTAICGMLCLAERMAWRTRNSNWEYVQHFGQQHATALGTLMSKAFHFMEQTDPAKFLERAMAEAAR